MKVTAPRDEKVQKEVNKTGPMVNAFQTVRNCRTIKIVLTIPLQRMLMFSTDLFHGSYIGLKYQVNTVINKIN